MSAKRNHHKQPNFYLKGFKSSDEGNPKVWVYEKGKPFYDGKTEQLQNPKHLTTEKAARTRDFYAFENEDGTKEYDKYEDWLMKEFEQPADSVIEKIRRFQKISEAEMQIFLRYVAAMNLRGDWWNNKRKYLDLDLEREVKNYVKTLSNVEDQKEWLETMKKALKANECGEFGKETIIQGIEDLSGFYFQRLKWRGFLISNKDISFPTSDNPVISTSFHKENPSLFFPVSSDICFFGMGLEHASQITFSVKNDSKDTSTLNLSKWQSYDKEFWLIDVKSAETIRKFIVCSSLKEVYHSQKAEWLVRFISNRIDK